MKVSPRASSLPSDIDLFSIQLYVLQLHRLYHYLSVCVCILYTLYNTYIIIFFPLNNNNNYNTNNTIYLLFINKILWILTHLWTVQYGRNLLTSGIKRNIFAQNQNHLLHNSSFISKNKITLPCIAFARQRFEIKPKYRKLGRSWKE